MSGGHVDRRVRSCTQISQRQRGAPSNTSSRNSLPETRFISRHAAGCVTAGQPTVTGAYGHEIGALPLRGRSGTRLKFAGFVVGTGARGAHAQLP